MSAATPISTRTRHQRSSAPLLSLSTTLAVPSRISKSRTPKSAFPRSALSVSPAPSSASAALSAVSLASARSFSTAASSPCSPHAAKAIAAVATPSSAMSALSFSEKNIVAGTSSSATKQEQKRKTRVVPWPSEMYARAEQQVGGGSDNAPPPATVDEAELGGYLHVLRGALSRQSSVAAGSMSPQVGNA